MNAYLDCRNYPADSPEEQARLAQHLDAVISRDMEGDIFGMLGRFQRILSDNHQRHQWDGVFEKLKILFMCGRYSCLDGPMIGVSMGIRDSDYFRKTARAFGKDRSAAAAMEWMATCWNATYAGTGLWMGKTFEPVSREKAAAVTGNNAKILMNYTSANTRIGRNFFRHPKQTDLIRSLGMPVLSKAWHLRERPMSTMAPGFAGTLLQQNLLKERNIPYDMTGGLFMAQPGTSVIAEMKGKAVYQLNYRWPALGPTYPMTRLVDELVQIADGVYLGQLVMATDRYSLGTIRAADFAFLLKDLEMGEPYRGESPDMDYGYQNNGFFLMVAPAFAREAYADKAFPHLRPRSGEIGYAELGYEEAPVTPPSGKSHVPGRPADFPDIADWETGWRSDDRLLKKFTTFCLEPSTRSDGDVRELLASGESILQMLQRLQKEISAQSAPDDHLRHFEALNRLFRCGIAPGVVDGMFQGQGRGYNTRFDAPETLHWYGKEEPCHGFDYYHGATLNLHMGFGDTLHQGFEEKIDSDGIFPSALACLLQSDPRGPNVLNEVWASIGRFIFPWAGKSFERISGRKLSMLLDESSDLSNRYPDRVAELKHHPASWPHYDLVKKNRDHYWEQEGLYAPHLKGGPWDGDMSDTDKKFWEEEAARHWVFGNNLEDSRILSADAMMRMLDMNYHQPISSIQKLVDAGPSPFVRQGYCFLGVSDQESILPMNNSDEKKKRVFQFHYRYPMIGGPAPIGACLDELVEIAEGLFLGQLIYSTVLLEPFHTSVDPAKYKYQLFGYFLLLDNIWEQHRQAIGFDINR